MNKIVPWQALVSLIQPHARGAHQVLGVRPPCAVETMLRIHCLQLRWNLSDPATEEALHERPSYHRFVGKDGASTTNGSGERDPEMHQTKKANQWHFGMKAHIGVDANSGLVHTAIGTAANVNDVTQASASVQ